jgi:tRNA(Ile)-lysidine synthase TilS/MesJ
MQRTIPTPPWTQTGRQIESLVRKAILKFDLLKDQKKIGIALSGGKDSMTLLYVLKAISGRGVFPFEIEAFHVSGAFSCGASLAEKILQKACDEIEVPLHILQSTQTLETLECYSCSRERRKLLFTKALERGISTLAFGHHKEDNVETLFMNLLHTASFEGMLAKVPMLRYGVTIIRPLILVDEASILNFSEQYGFLRVMCQCPVGQKSRRKTVKEILKDLSQEFPNAINNLSEASFKFGTSKALSPDLNKPLSPLGVTPENPY